MLLSLSDFLNSYWMYLVGGAAACGIMSYFSEKFYRYLKKALILFAVLFALAAGYEVVSGRNIFSLPGRVDQKLDEESSRTETGRRYYKSYEERYGEKPPGNSE